ncbi:hypothetical protein CYMTET_52584 [Cymbomonas tetramitiformis]|uniref:PROP1-like PPR domain-containing protein n=1 Tax=Cymbomonas tetramitiformis TaxID=36881 RepID=A0AAE0EQN6_9CHLO|nr:hypothetical protein CYMTET_52584 [Cymbomonas tetramitiformis]
MLFHTCTTNAPACPKTLWNRTSRVASRRQVKAQSLRALLPYWSRNSFARRNIVSRRTRSATKNSSTIVCETDEDVKRAAQEEWEKALVKYNTANSSGHPPTTKVYNNLLEACNKGEFWDTAGGVYKAMRARKVTFDLDTYEILLSSCLSTLQHQLAFELYAEMRKTGVSISSAAYCALLRACLQEGEECSRALLYYTEMKADGVPSSLEAVRVLLRVCAAARPLQAAPIQTIQADASAAGLSLDAECWQLVLGALAQTHQWEGVLQLYEELLETEVELDTSTCNMVMNAYRQQDRWNDVLMVHDQMVAWGAAPDGVTYRHQQEACGHLGDLKGVLQVCEAMWSVGKVAASNSAYAALVRAAASDLQWEHAYEIYQVSRRRGIEAPAATSIALLDLCGHGDFWDLGFASLGNLERSGQSLHTPAFEAVIDTLWEEANQRHAQHQIT